MSCSFREINKKIKSIQKVKDNQIKTFAEKFCGYIITLEDDSEIKLLIEQTTYCCEDYNIVMLFPFYKIKNNNLSEQEELKDVEIKTIKFGIDIHPEYKEQARYKQVPTISITWEKEINSAVIDIQTSKGLVQVVIYNYHNGNYRHNMYVEWTNYKDFDLL
jgi:hypothetical protein